MASELLGQPPLAHPAEAGGCHVSLHLPLTYLLQATHIVQWLYYLLPSCKTRVGSSSPMAKGVQAPFLALVKSRMAHDRCGKLCATDISLWPLATRRALWPDVSTTNKDKTRALKMEIYPLGLPKARDFEHFCCLKFEKLSLGAETENITAVQGIIFLYRSCQTAYNELTMKIPQKFINLLFSF